jgi:type VI secretion system secreted protein Hcp
MAVDMFLKLDGVKGESKDKAHGQDIDILSWSWGMSNSGSAHQGSGAGSGKVNVQDVSITKYIDSSSPKLMLSCCDGKHFESAVLIVRKAGEKPVEYVTIKMQEVLITSVSTGGCDENDKRGLDANMWLEVIDPKHRHGFQLSRRFAEWRDAGAHDTSFWEYIGDNEDKKLVEINYRIDAGVAFEYSNKLINTHGSVLSTKDMDTKLTGGGWGIFACDYNWNLYCCEHNGDTYHTSLVAGQPIRAAGEIVVDEGIVNALTGQTGHYWTTVELMLKFVRHFREIGASAVIRPNLLDQELTGQINWYRVGEFRINGLNAKPISVGEVNAAIGSAEQPTGKKSGYYNSAAKQQTEEEKSELLARGVLMPL